MTYRIMTMMWLKGSWTRFQNITFIVKSALALSLTLTECSSTHYNYCEFECQRRSSEHFVLFFYICLNSQLLFAKMNGALGVMDGLISSESPSHQTVNGSAESSMLQTRVVMTHSSTNLLQQLSMCISLIIDRHHLDIYHHLDILHRLSAHLRIRVYTCTDWKNDFCNFVTLCQYTSIPKGYI